MHEIIFILALSGLAISVYLLMERMKKRLPVCIIGDNCATVWKSPYSKLFGVGNEVYGIVFYLAVAVIELFLWRGFTDSYLVLSEYIVIFCGFVMSCYYTYIQWRIIRAWCFWCTISAVIVWLMILVLVVM